MKDTPQRRQSEAITPELIEQYRVVGKTKRTAVVQ